MKTYIEGYHTCNEIKSNIYSSDLLLWKPTHMDIYNNQTKCAPDAHLWKYIYV